MKLCIFLGLLVICDICLAFQPQQKQRHRPRFRFEPDPVEGTEEEEAPPTQLPQADKNRALIKKKLDLLDSCPTRSKNELCENECLDNEDCSKSKICCKHSCGTKCVLVKKRVEEIPEVEEKPVDLKSFLQCPQKNENASLTCEKKPSLCSDDNDCGATQKCCFHNCQNKCIDIGLKSIAEPRKASNKIERNRDFNENNEYDYDEEYNYPDESYATSLMNRKEALIPGQKNRYGNGLYPGMGNQGMNSYYGMNAMNGLQNPSMQAGYNLGYNNMGMNTMGTKKLGLNGMKGFPSPVSPFSFSPFQDYQMNAGLNDIPDPTIFPRFNLLSNEPAPATKRKSTNRKTSTRDRF